VALERPRIQLVPPAPPAREPRPARRRAAAPAGARLRRGRVLILVAADAVALAVALAAAAGVAVALDDTAVTAPAPLLAVLAGGALAAWLAVFAAYRLYDGQSRTIAPGGADEAGALFHALLAGGLLFLLAGEGAAALGAPRAVAPLEAAAFIAAALVAVPAGRALVRATLLPHVVRPRRALVVGAGQVGGQVAQKLAAHPEWGLELAGFVDDDPVDVGPGPVLGRTADLTRIVEEHDIGWVLLAFSRTSCESMLEAVRAVRRPDVRLAVVPNYFELFASNAALEDLGGIPVVSLPPLRLSRPARTVKRAFDVVVAAAGLVLLAPVLAACALAVRLDGPGPILFRQARHGRGGRTFRILKLRTMVPGAEAAHAALDGLDEVDGPPFKLREDPRVTRVGRFLRRTSLDELPQLWNVLRGEMSLVGPRPFAVGESAQITGWAERRLDTTPGMTGLWQVTGRADVAFDERVKLDYIYVTNWSLWWDARILLRTVPAVLRRRGAY
jgi:exopolysaccharide biosynthesis polyprenyl glycosylphosphotransferase